MLLIIKKLFNLNDTVILFYIILFKLFFIFILLIFFKNIILFDIKIIELHAKLNPLKINYCHFNFIIIIIINILKMPLLSIVAIALKIDEDVVQDNDIILVVAYVVQTYYIGQ